MKIPEERIRTYLERRRADLTRASRELELEQLDWIESLGHRLKGNAATFGFPELGEVGARLESAARLRDLPAVRGEISRFSEWLARHPLPSVQPA